jgi:hypothetical protein
MDVMPFSCSSVPLDPSDRVVVGGHYPIFGGFERLDWDALRFFERRLALASAD